MASDVTATLEQLDVYNSFLGLNIANSPSYIIKEAWAAGAILMVVGAIMIPLISALTQWINTKLIPQTPSTGDASADSMAQSMKTMNVTMPIMSAFFCFTLPAGMGIYWIAGSVVRSVQQILINKHIDRMDWDAEIAKNVEKQKKKKSKKSISAEKMNQYASMNTKKVMPVTTITSSEKEEAMKKAAEYSRTAKPGSIAAKAGMVREYNERNNK